MKPTLPRAASLLVMLAALPALLAFDACDPLDLSGYAVVEVAAGPDLEARTREALFFAKPGTIVQLPPGVFEFTDELVINTSHIALRGAGAQQTILDFANQQTGGQAILVRGDAFVMQDIGVRDSAGDGVRVEGVDAVTFQRVHVTWSGEPSVNNGAYGLYPVDSRNVVIEESYVFGASDAGFYVGQCENVIVRRNLAAGNVAGIEIENSKNADVYLNEATDNTGGLLVFDLPGLPKRGCRADSDPGEDEPGCKGTRVFANWIHDNDRLNFAPPGNTVALVPYGTGVVVLATDSVEIFGNLVLGNDTASIAVVSQAATTFPNPPSSEPGYDGYPERIDVHHNLLIGGGENPDQTKGLLGLGGIAFVFFSPFGPGGVPCPLAPLPCPIPEVVYDGFVDSAKTGEDGLLPEPLRVCIEGNADEFDVPATFGSLNGLMGGATFDLAPHTCPTGHDALPETTLDPGTAPPVVEDPYTPQQIAALCAPDVSPGAGVNWAAYVVDCPNLAAYRLFANPEDPTAGPNPGGFGFDLTTPLFSDYALKHRFVFLPPNTHATYHESESFDFPVGTIIAKSFAFAHDLNQPALGSDLVETRLLIHRPEGWVGRPYIWNEEKTEATLQVGGGFHTVNWTHTDGSARTTRYQIPSASQCSSCHRAANGDPPIGTKARLLNRDVDYPDFGTANQLEHWSAMGWLSGAPESAADAPRLPVWNDPDDGSLEERARAYLETNCQHCHNSGEGRARSTGVFFDHDRALDLHYGICKRPTAAGSASGLLDFIIVPGLPEESILIRRMASTAPQIKMPEVEKSVAHSEGLALVGAWIQTLGPSDCND